MMLHVRFIPILFGLIFITYILPSCDKNEILSPDIPEETEDSTAIEMLGTGSFVFDSYAPLSNKPVEVFYHVPLTATAYSPILFVLHGGGRDGMQNRDQLINKADQHNCILVCPTFSSDYYPGGDSYNLGNVFVDGDNPSSSSLNPQSEWTFAVFEPLFDKIRSSCISNVSVYDVMGFSAGAQVAHRFMIFSPNARINRIVAAASGWYTVLNNEITFPYGLEESPAEQLDLSLLFSKKLYVIVGSNDNDENAPGLRRNDIVDLQGLNRLDRAQHFYDEAQNSATSLSSAFNWEHHILPNVGHEFMGNSYFGMDLLY